MGNIPKWKIPPNPDIPYEKSKADWADYWFEAIRHGEDFIATPEGCYESKTAPLPPHSFGRVSMCSTLLIGVILGALIWHIVTK